MPSDCQCSNACDCQTIVKTKVLNNKEATRKIARLEEEVALLKYENDRLKRASKRRLPKKELVNKLKKMLDEI
jgi:hypothetical protein